MGQTVEQLVKSSVVNKIWLCPHVVHKPSFSTNNLLKGIECTKSTVPKQLLDKEVRKEFKEGGFLCIIWYNDPANEEEMKKQEVIIPGTN